MGKTIQLFMWGYQGHFRTTMESKANDILKDLAPNLEPAALLVGVQAPDANEDQKKRPRVCVEPEDEEWDPEIFSHCDQRTEEIFKDHPDHNAMYGDPWSMRDKPENIRKKSVYEAVRETFDRYDGCHGTTTYCVMPVKVEGYYVVLALQVNKAQLNDYARIRDGIKFRDSIFSGGFIDFVINELLKEAHRALWSPEPGRFYGVLKDDQETIFRRAGVAFCSVFRYATENVMFGDVFHHLNNISAMRYEGAAGSGTLIVASSKHPSLKMSLEFMNPVPLGEPRWARKILEMSSGNLCAICTDNRGIRGLGELSDQDADRAFIVEFVGHFRWRLRHKRSILLQSSFGVPSLPRATIKENTFKSTFRRIFDGVSAEDEIRIWQIVDAASRQRHGTMVVVSDSAQEESVRLKDQSTSIRPTTLSIGLAEQASGIDGAILIDRYGTCYAIGTILDGMAVEGGSPARGARFNSALRYFESRGDTPMLLVIVSEDGSVDLIPELLPQIARSAIDRKIDRLKKCDIHNYGKAITWITDHKFYLDDEQCETVNAEIARIESVPLEPNEFRWDKEKFKPDPRMDSSYYLPEPFETQ